MRRLRHGWNDDFKVVVGSGLGVYELDTSGCGWGTTGDLQSTLIRP